MKRKTIEWSAQSTFTVAALLVTPFADVGAAGLGFEVTAGAGQSDNVTREEINEQEETIATAGLRLSLDERTNRMAADLVGDFAFYDYLDDTYDSEFIGSFVGNTSVTLIEDRLKWLVSDDFGQVLNDPLTPSTPGNRENLNYFGTGLEGVFGFGARTELNVGAHYSLASYEESPLDSSNVTGDIGISRQMSNANSLGFNLRTIALEYAEDEFSGSNYDQNEAFLRYAGTGSRTRLNADVGYAQIDPDGGDSQSDFLLRLQVARQLSTRAIVRLSAGQEFSNSAIAFSTEQSGDPVDIDSSPGRQTADPFTYQYGSLALDLEGNRTAVSLWGSWRKQDHHELPILNQTLTSIGGTISRDLSAAVRLALDVIYTSSEFEQDNSDYNELDSNLSLSWQMSRRMFVRLAYDYSDRASDVTLGDFTENRLWLSFGYQHGTPKSSLGNAEFMSDTSGAGN